MISVFNEEEYALDVLKNGFINNNKKGLDIFILAKYYKFKQNKNKKECKEQLISFCQAHMEDYNNSEMYRNINYAVNTIYKKDIKFLDIDYIEFNQYELEYIKNTNLSDIGKQLLFCLWCCNKLNIKAGQSDKWIKIDYLKLKTFCNFKNGNMATLLNELYKNNMIFVSDSCAICLTFLDEYNDNFNKIIEAENKNDISPIQSYYIDDFSTCGLWWKKYNGDKKIINCQECGVLTVRNSNRQKYCKDCAKEKELNGKLLYNKTYYQQHKIN